MKKYVPLFVLAALVCSCKNEEPRPNKTVVLSGSITNYDQDTLFMENVSSEYMLFQEEIRKLPLTGRTDFEYQFELDKPAYFRIGRTFLYLSPGDSLVADLNTRDRTLGTFSGKGAEANNYLTNVPYPKGGSFWGDRDVSSKIKDYTDMPGAFKKSMKIRMDELAGLTTVSEHFRHLEKARTKFDYANSLGATFYLYYRKVREGEMTEKEMNQKMGEADKYLIPFKKGYLDDFNNREYLQLEVFQSLLYDVKDDNFRKSHHLPELDQSLKEYVLTNEIVRAVQFDGYSSEVGQQIKDGIERVTNPDYKAVLENLEAEYEPILKGKPASDLTFTKLDSSTVKLSDYEGKVLVLDLWATWCGPCMKEKPYFEALEKKYQSDEHIAFISLSIDKEKIWRQYFDNNEAVGTQLQINRSELSAYKVEGIPRFFVIDKGLNIVDVFAPLPSSGDLEKVIHQTLTSG